jgi:hypothetical protein
MLVPPYPAGGFTRPVEKRYLLYSRGAPAKGSYIEPERVCRHRQDG